LILTATENARPLSARQTVSTIFATIVLFCNVM